MDNLERALSFGGILNDDEIITAASGFTTHHLATGETFIKQGRPSDKLAFIDKGIFRVVITNEEEEEATKYFMRTNQFLMDIESFYSSAPAIASVQAVIDSTLRVSDRATWQRLCEQIPKLFILTKSLTESALINKIKDNDYLSFGTSKQKYQEFVKRYPDLALAVPLQYIASYLNITPQSLSRIRKEK